MSQPTFSKEEKLKAVMVSLEPDDETDEAICEHFEISQATLQQWRKRFVDLAKEAFMNDLSLQRDQQLQTEIRELKEILGELTIEVHRLRRLQ